MREDASDVRAATLPVGAECYRMIGPFDADSLPSGLRAVHRLKLGTWGLIELAEGAIAFVWDDELGGSDSLSAPARLVVPPEVPHHVESAGPFSLTIGFYRVKGD